MTELLLLPGGNQTLPEANLTAVSQSGGLALSVHLDNSLARQDGDPALGALAELLGREVETGRLELETSLPSVPLGESQLADGLFVCHEPHLLGERGPHVGQVFLVTNNQNFSQGIPAVDNFLLNLPPVIANNLSLGLDCPESSEAGSAGSDEKIVDMVGETNIHTDGGC